MLVEQAFGVSFTLFDGDSGEVLQIAPDQPSRDWGILSELCREVSRCGRPEFMEEEGPFLTFALPWTCAQGAERVAVAMFVTRPVEEREDLGGPAALLGIHPEDASAWARRQTPRTAESLQRVADLAIENAGARQRIQSLQKETNSLSVNLASTYEEISLLYRLTQNLKISKSDEDLGRVVLEWMQDVVPAAGLAMQLKSSRGAGKSTSRADGEQPSWLCCGDCPLDAVEFARLMKHLGVGSLHRPIVVNRPVTQHPIGPVRPFIR